MSKAWRQDISVGRVASATGLSEGGAVVRLLVWDGMFGEDLRENHDEEDGDDDLEGAAGACAGAGAVCSGLLLSVSVWNRARNFEISGSISGSVDLVDGGGVDAGACEACPGAGDLGGDGEAQSQPMMMNNAAIKGFEENTEKTILTILRLG